MLNSVESRGIIPCIGKSHALHFYCTDAETFAVDCENDTFIPPQEFDIDATIDDDPEWSVFEELSAGTETMGSHF